MAYILKKEENIPTTQILKFNWKFSKIFDPNSNNYFSLFEVGADLKKNQSEIYQCILSKETFKIIPKFFNTVEKGLIFQPLKNINEMLEKQMLLNEFIYHYKYILNGLAFLQTLGLSAKELTLDSIFISENGEIKLIFFEKVKENHENYFFSKVQDFVKMMICLVLRDKDVFENYEFLSSEDLEKILILFSEKFIDPSFELHVLIKIFKKILLKRKPTDFLQLFLGSLQLKTRENFKKIIYIEETHGIEVAADILMKKGLMKFDLRSFDNSIEIFGTSSTPMERKFLKITEIKNLIEEIKPITCLNFKISTDIKVEIMEVLNLIINKKMFNLDDFKSLVIQTTPNKSLVGNSEWYKFMWSSFIQTGLKPIENSGISLIKEHHSQWFD